MAEGAGFEPAVGVNLRTLSKRAPSTTQPPLREGAVWTSAGGDARISDELSLVLSTLGTVQ